MNNVLFKNVVSFCAFFGAVFVILTLLSLTNLSDLSVFTFSVFSAVILVFVDAKRPIACIHRMAKVSAYVTVSYILAGAASLHRVDGFGIVFVLAIINMVFSSIVLIIRIYMDK